MRTYIAPDARRYPTVIDRMPSGRFALVGSVPFALTEPQIGGTPQIPPARRSLTWATLAEARAALDALGLPYQITAPAQEG